MARRCVIWLALSACVGCGASPRDALLAVDRAERLGDGAALLAIARRASAPGPVRQLAARVLARLPGDAGVIALRGALDSLPIAVQRAALVALLDRQATTKAKRALLARFLSSSNVGIRRTALLGLADQRPLDDRLWNALLSEAHRRPVARLSLRRMGWRAVPRLARALAKADGTSKRAIALRRLLGEVAALPAATLGAYVGGGRSKSTASADARALEHAARAATPSALSAKLRARIVRALRSADRDQRVRAARALVATTGPARGLPLLLQLPSDEAAGAATLWDGRRVEAALLGDAPTLARPTAQRVAVLGAIVGPRGRRALLAASASDDAPVARLALLGLGRRARAVGPLTPDELRQIKTQRGKHGGAAALALWLSGETLARHSALLVSTLSRAPLRPAALAALGERARWLADTAAIAALLTQLKKPGGAADTALANALRSAAGFGLSKEATHTLVAQAKKRDVHPTLVDAAVAAITAREIDIDALASLRDRLHLGHWRRALRAGRQISDDSARRALLGLALASRLSAVRAGALRAVRENDSALLAAVRGRLLDARASQGERAEAARAFADLVAHLMRAKKGGGVCQPVKPALAKLFAADIDDTYKAHVAMALDVCGDARGRTWALAKLRKSSYVSLSPHLLRTLLDGNAPVAAVLRGKKSVRMDVGIVLFAATGAPRWLEGIHTIPASSHTVRWLRRRYSKVLAPRLPALPAAHQMTSSQRAGLIWLLGAVAERGDFGKADKLTGAAARLAAFAGDAKLSAAGRATAQLTLVARAGAASKHPAVASARRALVAMGDEPHNGGWVRRELARAGICAPLARMSTREAASHLKDKPRPWRGVSRCAHDGKAPDADAAIAGRALNSAAWNLARCRGLPRALAARALLWATRAAQLYRCRRSAQLDTLALALARVGRFDDALAVQLAALSRRPTRAVYALRARAYARRQQASGFEKELTR